MRGLAGLLLEAHAQELRLATRLDLGLRQDLPLGLLGGEPRDGLELAALLLHRRAEPGLLLAQAPLPIGERAVAALHVALPPVELIEPPAELLLLLDDPALDLLDLPLAGPRLLVQLRPDLQGHLLGLEVGVADPGLGLAHLAVGVGAGLVDQALGVLEDAGGARLGVAERPRGGGAGSEISDEEGEDGDQRQQHQPRHGNHRSLHPGARPGPDRVHSGLRAANSR